MAGESGSPRKYTRDGVTYNVAGDADLQVTSKKTIEAIVHSGGNDAKVLYEDGKIEAIKLKLSLEQWEALEETAELTLPQSVTFQDGSVKTGPGFISLGPWTSADAVCELVATPSDTWDFFGA